MRWFAGAAVCGLSVLVLGPLPAVFIAFGLSVIDIVRRLSHPETAVLKPTPDGETYLRTQEAGDAAIDGVIVYRFGAPLQFANASAFMAELSQLVDEAPAGFRGLVLDLQAVSDVDSSGEEMLREAVHLVGERGGRIALARAEATVVAQLERYALFPPLDSRLVFDTNRAAVAALSARRR